MSQREHRENTEFLDQAIPLKGVSHAEVVGYSVEVPMRYAEVFAMLADGSKVKLKNTRQFLGWSGPEEKRCLLFQHGRRRFVIETGADQITLSGVRTENGTRKFIARDGSLLFIRRWSQDFATSIRERMPTPAMPGFDFDGMTAGATI